MVTADRWLGCLGWRGEILAHTSVNPKGCRPAAAYPKLLATDLTDYLVGKDVAFRQAHHLVGAVVALAEQRKKPLDQLSLAEFRGIDGRFGPDVKKVFDLEKAMRRRAIVGAPGTREVRRQLTKWKKMLA